jgi:hypothetical protein
MDNHHQRGSAGKRDGADRAVTIQDLLSQKGHAKDSVKHETVSEVTSR